MRPFHTIVLVVFGFMAVVAIGVFSFAPKKGDPKLAGASGNVMIWGTFELNADAQTVLNLFNAQYKDSFSVSYAYHDPADFDRDIVEALAAGRGPDVLLLPDDLVMRHSDKIEMIPYQSFPEDAFQSKFVEAAEIYMRDNGLIALPFLIDPMIMYWNRDLFTNASLTSPPRYWDDYLGITPKLTKRNPKNSEIIESAVAFGEFANVAHAKDVLAMLFLQVGNPIVAIVDGRPISTLSSGGTYGPSVAAAVSSLRFFVDFSNPQKATYTWNRARGNSLNEFIDGTLATHFDYASAYPRIAAKNPHLNFSVAQVPVLRDASTEITFTKIYGLAITKNSKNKSTAFIAVQRLLSDPDVAKNFSAAFSLPPVLRASLAVQPTDTAQSTFYKAAIRGRTWLDPRPSGSNDAFRATIEAVSSGRSDIDEAIKRLDAELNALLKSR